MYSKEIFDQDCRLCKRLDDFLCEIKQKHPDYHTRPVAPFGDKNPKLLIVGLAPGMHGANATGRPFTKDCALKLSSAVFAHNAQRRLPGGRTLIDSYHTSRYNMQTRRLTKGFGSIAQARKYYTTTARTLVLRNTNMDTNAVQPV